MPDYEYTTADGKIICQLCGKPFSKITPAHLKHKHDGMTFEKYQELFPEAPLSNDAFKLSRSISQKFDTFKKNSEELKENAPVPSVKRVLNQKPLPVVEPPKDEEGYGPNVHKDKAIILTFLSRYYPALINNYVVEFYTPSDHLEFIFQTDMADPISKTIFEFPSVIWHNRDIRPNGARLDILKENGWKTISVDSPIPSIEDLKQKLDIISES